MQGSAADFLKLAMARVGKLLKDKYKDGVRLLLTVHDELVFEVSNDLVMVDVVKLLKSQMELTIGGVFLAAEAKVGDNWGEMVLVEGMAGT